MIKNAPSSVNTNVYDDIPTCPACKPAGHTTFSNYGFAYLVCFTSSFYMCCVYVQLRAFES